MRVLVVGGGVVGLSVARELAGRGENVTLVERGGFSAEASGGASSWAALGVLSLPKSGESALGRLHALAYRRYPALARSLLDETQIDIGYRVPGALHLERHLPAIAARAKIENAYRRAGFRARWLGAEELRELAPAVAGDFIAALHLPEEAVVHPPDLVRALHVSCRLRGVSICENAGAARALSTDEAAVELESGEVISGDACVVAAGAWSPVVLRKLGASSGLVVEPIRGQALEARCRWDDGPNIHFKSERYEREYYLIGRGAGRAWVGSTVEDVGFRGGVTPAGVEQLVSVLCELIPAATRSDVLRAWSGLRPKAMRRGGPFLGRLPGSRKLWVACGHYRSGILAGPLSAELLVSEMLAGQPPPWCGRAERGLLKCFAVRREGRE